MQRTGFSFRPNLLLVEDDAMCGKPLARLLGFCGFNVNLAGNVRDAIATYKSKHFDFVVADLTLPDGDGFGLLEQLLQHRPTVAVALTGWTDPTVATRCQEAGFVAQLIKPVEIKDLLKVMYESAGKFSQPVKSVDTVLAP